MCVYVYVCVYIYTHLEINVFFTRCEKALNAIAILIYNKNK